MELKWTIHELIKRAKNNNFIEEQIDLRPFLSSGFEDLADIVDTEVNGHYHYYEDEELFVFKLNVKTKLIMLCSITLKEVPIDLDFQTQLNFSTNYVDDDTHIIDGITIDLRPYVFSEILIEKPMRVIAPGAEKLLDEENTEMTEDEKLENNPFAKLKQ